MFCRAAERSSDSAGRVSTPGGCSPTSRSPREISSSSTGGSRDACARLCVLCGCFCACMSAWCFVLFHRQRQPFPRLAQVIRYFGRCPGLFACSFVCVSFVSNCATILYSSLTLPLPSPRLPRCVPLISYFYLSPSLSLVLFLFFFVRGEIIGNAVADKREKLYENMQIGSDYMFRVDEVSGKHEHQHMHTMQAARPVFVSCSEPPSCPLDLNPQTLT